MRRSKTPPTLPCPPLPDAAPAGAYFAARLTGDDPAKAVTVYLRKHGRGYQVVGVDRAW